MPFSLSRGRVPTAAFATRPVRRLALWPLLCLGGLVAAVAPAASAAPPDPSDPAAIVAPTAFASPLAAYRPWAPPATKSWREVNDTVARIGGWRVYLREAQQPDPAPATSSPPSRTNAAPMPAPAPGGAHGHHGGHGAGSRP